MTHPFTPSADDKTRCGHRLSHNSGFEGGTCGFPAANRRVHAPGAVEQPERRLAAIREDTVPVAVGAPEPSRVAATIAKMNRATKRYEIVSHFAHPSRRYHGWTCQELEAETHTSHETASSAITGLKGDGIIVPLVVEGEAVTRPTRSGATATVYVLTEAGRAAYYAESA